MAVIKKTKLASLPKHGSQLVKTDIVTFAEPWSSGMEGYKTVGIEVGDLATEAITQELQSGTSDLFHVDKESGIIGNGIVTDPYKLDKQFLDDLFVPANLAVLSQVGDIDKASLPIAGNNYSLAYIADKAFRKPVMNTEADGRICILSPVTNGNDIRYTYNYYNKFNALTTHDLVYMPPLPTGYNANEYYIENIFVKTDKWMVARMAHLTSTVTNRTKDRLLLIKLNGTLESVYHQVWIFTDFLSSPYDNANINTNVSGGTYRDLTPNDVKDYIQDSRMGVSIFEQGGNLFLFRTNLGNKTDTAAPGDTLWNRYDQVPRGQLLKLMFPQDKQFEVHVDLTWATSNWKVYGINGQMTTSPFMDNIFPLRQIWYTNPQWVPETGVGPFTGDPDKDNAGIKLSGYTNQEMINSGVAGLHKGASGSTSSTANNLPGYGVNQEVYGSYKVLTRANGQVVLRVQTRVPIWGILPNGLSARTIPEVISEYQIDTATKTIRDITPKLTYPTVTKSDGMSNNTLDINDGIITNAQYTMSEYVDKGLIFRAGINSLSDTCTIARISGLNHDSAFIGKRRVTATHTQSMELYVGSPTSIGLGFGAWNVTCPNIFTSQDLLLADIKNASIVPTATMAIASNFKPTLTYKGKEKNLIGYSSLAWRSPKSKPIVDPIVRRNAVIVVSAKNGKVIDGHTVTNASTTTTDNGLITIEKAVYTSSNTVTKEVFDVSVNKAGPEPVTLTPREVIVDYTLLKTRNPEAASAGGSLGASVALFNHGAGVKAITGIYYVVPGGRSKEIFEIYDVTVNGNSYKLDRVVPGAVFVRESTVGVGVIVVSGIYTILVEESTGRILWQVTRGPYLNSGSAITGRAFVYDDVTAPGVISQISGVLSRSMPMGMVFDRTLGLCKIQNSEWYSVPTMLLPIKRSIDANQLVYDTGPAEEHRILAMPYITGNYIVSITDRIPFYFNGVPGNIEPQSFDLTEVSTDAANKTFGLMLSVNNGVPKVKVVLNPQTQVETNNNSLIAIVKTGPDTVQDIIAPPYIRIGKFRLSSIPRGSSIPVSAGTPDAQAFTTWD